MVEEIASSSNQGRRSSISNAKFEVKKFDEKNNLGMWQCEVLDVLIQQELDIALEDKLAEMFNKDWNKINWLAFYPVMSCKILEVFCHKGDECQRSLEEVGGRAHDEKHRESIILEEEAFLVSI